MHAPLMAAYQGPGLLLMLSSAMVAGMPTVSTMNWRVGREPRRGWQWHRWQAGWAAGRPPAGNNCGPRLHARVSSTASGSQQEGLLRPACVNGGVFCGHSL